MMMYRCHSCNSIFNIGGVEVIARYSDCTVFKTPCCSRTVDDRQWKSLVDVSRVEPWELREARRRKDGLYGKLNASGMPFERNREVSR